MLANESTPISDLGYSETHIRSIRNSIPYKFGSLSYIGYTTKSIFRSMNTKSRRNVRVRGTSFEHVFTNGMNRRHIKALRISHHLKGSIESMAKYATPISVKVNRGLKYESYKN